MKRFQMRLRESSKDLGLWVVKVLSGAIIGFTIALVFQTITSMGNLIFTFVIVLSVGVFLKLSKKWRFAGVIMFNLFCVMTVMLLRMYILIAPGQ